MVDVVDVPEEVARCKSRDERDLSSQDSACNSSSEGIGIESSSSSVGTSTADDAQTRVLCGQRGAASNSADLNTA